MTLLAPRRAFRVAVATVFFAVGVARPALAGSTFSGIYAGGSAGFSFGSLDTTFLAGAGAVMGPAVEQDLGSGVAGAILGAQTQIGPWIVGVEGTYTAFQSHALLSQTGDFPLAAPAPFTETDTLDTSVDDLVTVAGRIGYSWSPGFMTYVKGGFATASIATTATFDVVSFNTARALYTARENYNGWTVGIGAEAKLAPNVVIGFGYDYMSFFAKTSDADVALFLNGALIATGTEPLEIAPSDIHLFMARLTFLLDLASP